MKSSEIKKGRFYYLLHEYEGIWDSVRLCGDKLEDMSREKYILEKHLREMGEQIFALTDSDKEKLNIAHNLGFAGIKLGPLMAKFMKGERSNTENRETKSDEREIKFQELKDIFYCLFYEYKKIWRSSQVRGTPWVEQLREEYILKENLRKLGEKVCDLTDSDEVKLDIAYHLWCIGVTPELLMPKFMKEEMSKYGK